MVEMAGNYTGGIGGELYRCPQAAFKISETTLKNPEIERVIISIIDRFHLRAMKRPVHQKDRES